MGTTLNNETLTKMLKENIEWLEKQDKTLERDHTILVLRDYIVKMSDDSFNIQQKTINNLRIQLNHHKAESFTYLQEIVKAHKGLRRLSRKADTYKERYKVDSSPNVRLLIHLKCLMDAAKPYLKRKKMTSRDECNNLNMVYDSCTKLRHKLISKDVKPDLTESDNNVTKARAIVAEVKKNKRDEEIAIKMLSYLKRIRIETGKSRYDIQMMLGLLDVVREQDIIGKE